MTITVDLQIAFDGEVPHEAKFQQWAESALNEVEGDCELSIRLVDESESAELNTRYRGKSGPTNVLSFPFDSPIPLEPRLLGDLVICVAIVEEEAIEQHKLSGHHWAHVVVHGCLHLLGYDHITDDEADIMEALEKTILQSISHERSPYQDQGDTK